MGEGGATRPALAVVISGAPGSGKTTLARLLGDRMGIPHLNKDTFTESLLRSGMPRDEANVQAFRVVYGTARTWLSSSTSLVMDMTMYPDYWPAEVVSLRPHGTVVHVHCRARDSLQRWERKMRDRLSAEVAEEAIVRLRYVQEIATEPLDFDCPRIDVDTSDGYEPGLDDLVGRIEALHASAS